MNTHQATVPRRSKLCNMRVILALALLAASARALPTPNDVVPEFVQNDQDDCDQCNNDPNRHNCEEMGYCQEAAKTKANKAAQQCGCDPKPCVADANADGCGTCVSCIAGKLGMSAEDLIKKAKSMATEELLQEKVKVPRIPSPAPPA